MKKSIGFWFLVIGCFFVVSCAPDSSGSKSGGETTSVTVPEDGGHEYLPWLTSIDDFLGNSLVKDTMEEVGFSILRRGTGRPDSIEGRYLASIKITDSSLHRLIGKTGHSNIILYNQTFSGKIKYKEYVYGASGEGVGSFIYGKKNKFVIFQEIEASNRECTVRNILIMNGVKSPNGNLLIKTITINRHKSNCGRYLIPRWYTTKSSLIKKSSSGSYNEEGEGFDLEAVSSFEDSEEMGNEFRIPALFVVD